MAIRYYCRHCATIVGELQDQTVDLKQLGFDALTNDERLDMITYQNNGNIDIKVICEDCQEALQRNPDFHSLHTFIQ